MEWLSEFKEILTAYLHQTTALITLLKEENRAIAGNATEELSLLTESKNQLLSQYKQTDEGLIQFLSQVSLETNLSTQDPDTQSIIRSLIQQAKGSERLLLNNLWNELQQSLAQTIELNRLNGSLIAVRLNAIRKTLDVIKYGNDDSAISYNPKGEVVSY